MRLQGALAILLGFGVTMCGSREHPKPETSNIGGHSPQQEAKPVNQEKPKSPARWIEVSTSSTKFLIAKIADAGHLPAGEFEGKEQFEGAAAGQNAGNVLLYLFVPNAAAAVEVFHETGGRRNALPKPRMVFRMPGSPLYTVFMANPSTPGNLVIRSGSKEESLKLPGSAQAFQALPFFWSGEPPESIAFDELPGWLEGGP